MITIAIAEDHQSLVDGISLLLKYENQFTIVGTYDGGLLISSERNLRLS